MNRQPLGRYMEQHDGKGHQKAQDVSFGVVFRHGTPSLSPYGAKNRTAAIKIPRGKSRGVFLIKEQKRLLLRQGLGLGDSLLLRRRRALPAGSKTQRGPRNLTPRRDK